VNSNTGLGDSHDGWVWKVLVEFERRSDARGRLIFVM
jgi:hypothetical protein